MNDIDQINHFRIVKILQDYSKMYLAISVVLKESFQDFSQFNKYFEDFFREFKDPAGFLPNFSTHYKEFEENISGFYRSCGIFSTISTILNEIFQDFKDPAGFFY